MLALCSWSQKFASDFQNNRINTKCVWKNAQKLWLLSFISAKKVNEHCHMQWNCIHTPFFFSYYKLINNKISIGHLWNRSVVNVSYSNRISMGTTIKSHEWNAFGWGVLTEMKCDGAVIILSSNNNSASQNSQMSQSIKCH